MSGSLARANPRCIKAAHRRRGKVASGQSVQRYYDPGIGRFLSVDPVAADTTTGSNFNRFAYANNNPYRFTDPDGRAGKELSPDPTNLDKITVTGQRPSSGTAPSSQMTTLGTVSVTAQRIKPIQIPWGRIGGSVLQGGAIPLTFVTGMWPYDMGYSACEMQGAGACGRMYSEAQPDERNLSKVKERDGNRSAQDAGYDDAHDAKKGRGEGGVDIYKDKSTGKNWLWNGVSGAEKEEL